MDLIILKKQPIDELAKISDSLGINNISNLSKKDLIYEILRRKTKDGHGINGGGVLETLPEGFGFLRSEDASYLSGPDDLYVSHSQIKKFGLRTGDYVYGKIRPPKDSEKYFALLQIETINNEPPNKSKNKILFENLTPCFPTKQLVMERGNGSSEDITSRIIDLVAPIGMGQRALIVAPPKSGKTLMLQNMAQSIAGNYPECYLIVLLIDERPEEVTDMKQVVRAEVVASTFDEPASRHVQVAEMVIEKAKRMVENGKDVIILLDSITRLARAYNTVSPSSGKILTGGVDANALHRPKRFFGAARNITQGRSLTIVATALIETGSRMDEVIFEEFKGTGNSEINLDRNIADRRIYPAINLKKSSTRREELLLNEDILKQTWIMRKLFQEMKDSEAIDTLINEMKKTKTNMELFDAMKRSQAS